MKSLPMVAYHLEDLATYEKVLKHFCIELTHVAAEK